MLCTPAYKKPPLTCNFSPPSTFRCDGSFKLVTLGLANSFLLSIPSILTPLPVGLFGFLVVVKDLRLTEVTSGVCPSLRFTGLGIFDTNVLGTSAELKVLL